MPRPQIELGMASCAMRRRRPDQAPAGLQPVMRPRDLPGRLVDGLNPDLVGSLCVNLS
jgi:hypothetical protein